MATFVIDASATLPWCLKDEESAWTISLLHRLGTGDRIIVPAHWPTEVSNGLLMATRRKRIPEGRAALFWDELAVLPITVEAALTPAQAKSALALCEQYRLTVYDAAYLELAKRKALQLATLDDALSKAAISESVFFVGC
jgi:predicted nucleic acid-binding protein